MICLPNVLNEKDEIVDRYLPHIDHSPLHFPAAHRTQPFGGCCLHSHFVTLLWAPEALSCHFVLWWCDVIICPKDNGKDCTCLNGTAVYWVRWEPALVVAERQKEDCRATASVEGLCCSGNSLAGGFYKDENCGRGHLWRVGYNPKRK